MSRYIDAEKIKFIEYINGDVTVSKDEVEKIPTADVQEVRHGRWIEQVKIRKNGEPRLVHWQCSLCGVFLGTSTANFCPHCGAKMDDMGNV